MSTLSGRTIGNYRLEDVVGKGGMGSVYRAQHVNLEREVAVKFLAQNLSEDEEFIQRFQREARLVAKLVHPNIVQVFDSGDYDGTPYLVMELLEGETLRQKIKRGPLPEEEAVAIIAAVLAGLGKAHGLGVVHRDIKPANIFLCRDGAVKVMDFGIAKATSEARLTGTGTQMGTPEYMSPEQAEGTAVDGRSDLYSVGIMLYEMLTGEVPFKADTPLSILHMQVTRTPPALPSSVPEWLRRLVSRSLEKSPSARFATVEAMRDALLSKSVPARADEAGLDLDFSVGQQRSTREQRRDPARTQSGTATRQAGGAAAQTLGQAPFPPGLAPGAGQVRQAALPTQAASAQVATVGAGIHTVAQVSSPVVAAAANVPASAAVQELQKTRSGGATGVWLVVGGCIAVAFLFIAIIVVLYVIGEQQGDRTHDSYGSGTNQGSSSSGQQPDFFKILGA